MGTRWRGLLAPIDKPTGDGRRFAKGSVTHRELPLALKWQRVDDMGHDDSVVIGLVDKLTVDDKAGEVWGEGELFDDQPNLPRLSEDVAEAMLLTSKKIIGPSVDAGAAEMVWVEEGTDEPLTEERYEQVWDETGQEPKIEALFTHYEIAAATLVVIPAFAEARPFELIQTTESTEPEEAPAPAALVSALTASAPTYPDEWFTNPKLSEVTPITVAADGRVYGHVAQWGICHVGNVIPGVCTTAPTSQIDYAMFHRYVQNTASGIVSTGRLTTGHGRIGTGCSCCHGKDDHACDDLSLGQAIDHYDGLKTLAWIRAGEDDYGIWIAGALACELDKDDERVLNRRSVSGDWRRVAGNWELTEVLALAKERPGFPLSVKLRDGRQTALLAAGGIDPQRVGTAKKPAQLINMTEFAGLVADQVVARMANVPPAVLAATGHTGAMVALVPSDDDAARLAVEGGEAAGELHLTLAYLGKADDIDAATQQSIIDAVTTLAGKVGPVAGEVFAVNVFNPEADDRDTAIVLGISGEDLEPVHGDTVETLQKVHTPPDQHAPWVAHVTLMYSDDLSLVEQFKDRTNQPVTFDRLRVAFAGVATDIPLTGKTKGKKADTAALLAEVERAIGDVDPDALARSAEAAGLLGELETASGV